MEKGSFIAFRTGESYSHEFLLKHITNEELNECVEKGYFNVVEKDELGEKVKKYVFTQKGKEFAWK